MSLVFLSRRDLPGRLPGACLGHGAGKHVLGELVPPGDACMNQGWRPFIATTRARLMHAVAARPLPVKRRLAVWLLGCLAVRLAGWVFLWLCVSVSSCHSVSLSLRSGVVPFLIPALEYWPGTENKNGTIPKCKSFTQACLPLLAVGVRLRSPSVAVPPTCPKEWSAKGAQNSAPTSLCKVMRKAVAGRWEFNRKLLQIGENRQNGISFRSENAHARAKVKTNQLTNVTCVSVST